MSSASEGYCGRKTEGEDINKKEAVSNMIFLNIRTSIRHEHVHRKSIYYTC